MIACIKILAAATAYYAGIGGHPVWEHSTTKQKYCSIKADFCYVLSVAPAVHPEALDAKPCLAEDKSAAIISIYREAKTK